MRRRRHRGLSSPISRMTLLRGLSHQEQKNSRCDEASGVLSDPVSKQAQSFLVNAPNKYFSRGFGFACVSRTDGEGHQQEEEAVRCEGRLGSCCTAHVWNTAQLKNLSKLEF